MSQRKRSISFDQAAEYYDRTRGLPPEAAAAVTALLRAELEGRGPCLEIGIGTGRIALPLAMAGIEIHGVDISAPMLARLRQKALAAGVEVRTQVGDATALPYKDDVFDAGIECRVFHLIDDWPQAARELVRVVLPGGVVLVETGDSLGLRARYEKRIGEIVGPERLGGRIVPTAEIDALMASLGAGIRPLQPIRYQRSRSVRQTLDAIASNQWAMTWSIAEALPDVVAQLSDEAAAERQDLDAPVSETVEIAWRAYDLP